MILQAKWRQIVVCDHPANALTRVFNHFMSSLLFLLFSYVPKVLTASKHFPMLRCHTDFIFLSQSLSSYLPDGHFEWGLHFFMFWLLLKKRSLNSFHLSVQSSLQFIAGWSHPLAALNISSDFFDLLLQRRPTLTHKLYKCLPSLMLQHFGLDTN